MQRSRRRREASCPVKSSFIRAAAYTRLSCDDKKKRGDSLETQLNIIENYAALNPDIHIVRRYSDNNATGTNFERPGFMSMISDIESGIINCIIVKDLSRFGRNAIDTGYYLEKRLPALGVRFIAVTDSYDSTDDHSGLLLPIKNIIAETYAMDISRKCRSVQHQNMCDGRFVGRLAPYGYQKSPSDCHQLIPDPETAPVVLQIFEWAAQGANAMEIARSLTAENIMTPGHRNREKGYGDDERLAGNRYWKARTIKEILADRVYLGDMVQGKTRKVNGKQIDVSKDKWIVVENTHEPVVSRELFERVQSIRVRTHEQALAIAKTNTYTPNVFKGKIFCGHCGYPMHRHKQKNHDYYWFRCESQVKYGKDICHVVSVKETDIKTAVMATLQKYSEVIRGEYIRLNNDTGVRAEAEAELRAITQQLESTGRYYRSLYESLIKGLITGEEHNSMRADYAARIDNLSRRADDLRDGIRNAEKQKNEYRDFAEAVNSAVNNDALTAELAARIVDKVTVRKDKSFTLRFLFDDEFGG